MSSIFNYQTFDVRLDKTTRTLWVELNRPPQQYINWEFLFEFETLMAWCSGKVEIHSIVLFSRAKKLSAGIDPDILKTLTVNKLENYTQKLQKITFSLMHLPQIIIADLGHGTNNVASELATACDIRVSHKSCQITFEHSKLGLMPSSGGISQLGAIAGQANARNWLLSGSNINTHKLEASGFVFFSYDENERFDRLGKLLTDIHAQAPVQRIQTKMGVTEHIRESVEQLNQLERKLAKAAMISEDWKVETRERMPAKHMKEAVKLSLVKDSEDIN
ncbi:MAG: hypothetical protein CME65_14005 [Halobacteriovoraceae bacterium]|nr:hypothetical protein [Halobacteriovoraceae bacterium]|tara:strand:- start:5458 stop:6285 length:828 start_codon:yes stop_codon:yes gene_type:complete